MTRQYHLLIRLKEHFINDISMLICQYNYDFEGSFVDSFGYCEEDCI